MFEMWIHLLSWVDEVTSDGMVFLLADEWSLGCCCLAIYNLLFKVSERFVVLHGADGNV